MDRMEKNLPDLFMYTFLQGEKSGTINPTKFNLSLFRFVRGLFKDIT